VGIGAPSPHSGPPHRFPAAASRAGVVVVVLLGCRCLFHRETSPSRARAAQSIPLTPAGLPYTIFPPPTRIAARSASRAVGRPTLGGR